MHESRISVGIRMHGSRISVGSSIRPFFLHVSCTATHLLELGLLVQLVALLLHLLRGVQPRLARLLLLVEQRLRLRLERRQRGVA